MNFNRRIKGGSVLFVCLFVGTIFFVVFVKDKKEKKKNRQTFNITKLIKYFYIFLKKLCSGSN